MQQQDAWCAHIFFLPKSAGQSAVIVMQIEVLGCSGAIAPAMRTSTFLLDADTLIDAGTGVYDMSLQAQRGIHHVFITHAHFDHIAGLAFLADSVARHRMDLALPPIKVYAKDVTLEAMHRHLFNNHIWPDFSRLPNITGPTLEFVPIDAGQTVELPGGRTVEALPAVHSVPAIGYGISCNHQHWLYTGDTGRNPLLWQRINALQASGETVRHLIIETTFSSEEQAFADLTGHLTVQILAQELEQLEQGGFDIHLTHLKPSDKDAITADLRWLDPIARDKKCTIHLLNGGRRFELGKSRLF